MNSLRLGALAAALALALAASCADGPPASPETSPERRGGVRGGQESLVVVARWPDGLPARDIRLGLYAPNAAGGAEPIFDGTTDDEGRLTFEVLGGSGAAVIRAEVIAIPWRVPVTLPLDGPIEVVLPPPHEVVVNVEASDPASMNDIGLSGRSFFDSDEGDLMSEGSLQQTAPGRFVWRSLHASPVRLDFLQFSSRWALRPGAGTKLVGDGEVEAAPPAAVHFEAVRKRRLLGRIVDAAGRPLPSAWIQWEFSPRTWNVKGDGEAGADGRFEILEPAPWASLGTPEGASVHLGTIDLRLGRGVEIERPWPGTGDLDLGDLVVELKPGWDVISLAEDVAITVVDDLGRPVAGADVSVLGETVGRSDDGGRVFVPDDGSPLVVRAPGHVPEEPDVIHRGPEVVLTRAASVALRLGPEIAPDVRPCLHAAWGEQGSLATAPVDSGGG